MADQVLHIAVEIDITDNSTASDSDMGLVSGFFRWVTGRPNYDGVTVVPTGENDGNVWYEGFILEPGQSKPDRIIDITKGGEYGSLSGFSFSIENASLFSAAVESGGYYLINRPVKVYAVIDDVFTQIWGGIVSDIKYNETEYSFKCDDIFKTDHKVAPPNSITREAFPGVEKSFIGESIPVVFGNVLRSPLLSVTSKAKAIKLGEYTAYETDFEDKDILHTFASAVYVDVDGEFTVVLSTPNQDFPAGFFAQNDYWLVVTRGSSQSIKIIGNYATLFNANEAVTAIKLQFPFEDVTVSDFNANNIFRVADLATTRTEAASNLVSENVWFFQVMKLNSNYISSNQSVNSFPALIDGNEGLVYWDSDKKEFQNVPELISDLYPSGGNGITYPNASLQNNEINIEGDYIRKIGVVPKRLKLDAASSQNSHFRDGVGLITPSTNELTDENLSLLIDRDRGTDIEISNGIQRWEESFLSIYAEFPDDEVIDDIQELYLCMDLSVVCFTANIPVSINIYSMGHAGGLAFNGNTSGTYPDLTETTNIYAIPNEYYSGSGNDASAESSFGKTISGTIIKDQFKIPESIVSSFKEAAIGKWFLIRINIGTTESNNEIDTIKLKQLGFVVTKKLNTIKEDFFIKTKGEEVSGNETDNVYRAFQHILETYDGLPSADIDYGNLSTTRNDWDIGRSLTEQKLSSAYLRELSKHSMVGLFPDRLGKRHMKSFRDDTTVVWTHAHDNGTIIKDSISSFEDTPVSQIYNDFELFYDWNPGLKKFNKKLFITNADQSAFPAITVSTGTDASQAFSTVSTVEVSGEWWGIIGVTSHSVAIGEAMSFFGGDASTSFSFGEVFQTTTNLIWVKFINNFGAVSESVSSSGTLTHHTSRTPLWTTYAGGVSDYAQAKLLWDACHASYLITNQLNKLPKDYSELHWFNDMTQFEDFYPIDSSAAHKYLNYLIGWVTRKKNIVSYSIPLTASNAVIDLLDVVSFKDLKYTNDAARTGWVTKVKMDLEAVKIDLEVTLEPQGISNPLCDTITETGSAPDTITESGSQPDTITEGACA